MSANAIETELQRRLGELLEPREYKLTKIDPYIEGFVRIGDGFRQSIIIPLRDYADAFQFSLTFGIRLEAVEALFLPFSGILPEYHVSSHTCLMNLNEFVPDLDRLTVYDDATIQRAVDQLTPHITNEILPFFDSHRDVRSLDHLMNRKGLPYREPAYLWAFAMHAAIVARLAQNLDFDTLVERYRHEIRDFDDDDKERYEKLVAHLRSLT
jgi:hypothetical protein